MVLVSKHCQQYSQSIDRSTSQLSILYSLIALHVSGQICGPRKPQHRCDFQRRRRRAGGLPQLELCLSGVPGQPAHNRWLHPPAPCLEAQAPAVQPALVQLPALVEYLVERALQHNPHQSVLPQQAPPDAVPPPHAPAPAQICRGKAQLRGHSHVLCRGKRHGAAAGVGRGELFGLGRHGGNFDGKWPCSDAGQVLGHLCERVREDAAADDADDCQAIILKGVDTAAGLLVGILFTAVKKKKLLGKGRPDRRRRRLRSLLVPPLPMEYSLSLSLSFSLGVCVFILQHFSASLSLSLSPPSPSLSNLGRGCA